MNEQVLELIKTYPVNGIHRYFWENGFDGVTKDLIFKGIQVAKSEPQGRTYCCGLTFELWFTAYNLLHPDTKLTGQDFKKIKYDWFVATGKRMGCVDGLVPRGLGTKVELKDAQPGDFMQIWRTTKSGHSVIYLSHNDKSITYWSTQTSTNGIGERTEILFPKGIVNETYLVRAI